MPEVSGPSEHEVSPEPEILKKIQAEASHFNLPQSEADIPGLISAYEHNRTIILGGPAEDGQGQIIGLAVLTDHILAQREEELITTASKPGSVSKAVHGAAEVAEDIAVIGGIFARNQLASLPGTSRIDLALSPALKKAALTVRELTSNQSLQVKNGERAINDFLKKEGIYGKTKEEYEAAARFNRELNRVTTSNRPDTPLEALNLPEDIMQYATSMPHGVEAKTLGDLQAIFRIKTHRMRGYEEYAGLITRKDMLIREDAQRKQAEKMDPRYPSQYDELEDIRYVRKGLNQLAAFLQTEYVPKEEELIRALTEAEASQTSRESQNPNQSLHPTSNISTDKAPNPAEAQDYLRFMADPLNRLCYDRNHPLFRDIARKIKKGEITETNIQNLPLHRRRGAQIVFILSGKGSLELPVVPGATPVQAQTAEREQTDYLQETQEGIESLASLSPDQIQNIPLDQRANFIASGHLTIRQVAQMQVPEVPGDTWESTRLVMDNMERAFMLENPEEMTALVNLINQSVESSEINDAALRIIICEEARLAALDLQSVFAFDDMFIPYRDKEDSLSGAYYDVLVRNASSTEENADKQTALNILRRLFVINGCQRRLTSS